MTAAGSAARGFVCRECESLQFECQSSVEPPHRVRLVSAPQGERAGRSASVTGEAQGVCSRYISGVTESLTS